MLCKLFEASLSFSSTLFWFDCYDSNASSCRVPSRIFSSAGKELAGGCLDSGYIQFPIAIHKHSTLYTHITSNTVNTDIQEGREYFLYVSELHKYNKKTITAHVFRWRRRRSEK